MFKRIGFIFCLILLFIPLLKAKADFPVQSFFIDSRYDISSRKTINASLFKKTNKINFYIDEEWLKNSSYDTNQLNSLLYQASTNFEYNIFPKLTEIYGMPANWQDAQWRLTVVFHSLKKDYGGYTRVEDLYSKALSSTSNNQPIIFLNTQVFKLPSFRLSSYLAHEFTHLLSLYLKYQKFNVMDDTWLEELRAELSESLTQDIKTNFSQSILKSRLENFVPVINFSLTDWQNRDGDYAIVNILGQYLLEKYGTLILKDSLNSSFTGIESINYALKKNGYHLTFNEILQNWMIATVFNDCSSNNLYCFNNTYLKNIQKQGDAYYIPTRVESEMVGEDTLKELSGRWLKFVGGAGTMNIRFVLNGNVPIYKIPYVIIRADGKKELGFLDFNSKTDANLYLIKTEEIMATMFLPSLGINSDNLYTYNFEVKNKKASNQDEQLIIKQLEQRIEELKRQVAALQLQLALMQTNQSNLNCSTFSSDLYFGITSPQVKCLQQFLANLGSDIYPEKLITGYYGPLTMAAVQRYQALNGIITTGYFGPLTRAAVSKEL